MGASTTPFGVMIPLPQIHHCVEVKTPISTLGCMIPIRKLDYDAQTCGKNFKRSVLFTNPSPLSPNYCNDLVIQAFMCEQTPRACWTMRGYDSLPQNGFVYTMASSPVDSIFGAWLYTKVLTLVRYLRYETRIKMEELFHFSYDYKGFLKVWSIQTFVMCSNRRGIYKKTVLKRPDNPTSRQPTNNTFGIGNTTLRMHFWLLVP